MNTPQPRTRDGGGWCWVHRKVLWEFAAHLGPIPTLTYVLLASHAREADQTARVSFGRVAAALGVTRDQARYALRKLERFGLIKRLGTDHPRGPSVYLLTDPSTWKIPKPSHKPTTPGAQSADANSPRQPSQGESVHISSPSTHQSPKATDRPIPPKPQSSVDNAQKSIPQKDVVRTVRTTGNSVSTQSQILTQTSSVRSVSTPQSVVANRDRGVEGKASRLTNDTNMRLLRETNRLKTTSTNVDVENSNFPPPSEKSKSKNKTYISLRARTLVRRTLGFSPDAAMAVEEVVTRSLEAFGTDDEFLKFVEERAWKAEDEGRLEIFENPHAATAWIKQVVDEWKGGST